MHGFIVREATDGQQALQFVHDFEPELVLTDLMMPQMDGFELIRRLHHDPETASLPVVAITADATVQAEQLAREAGASDVITKPIDLPTLLNRLESLPPLADSPQEAPGERDGIADHSSVMKRT